MFSSIYLFCQWQAQSVEDVMKLLQEGNRRRTTEPTAMNITSSRSHAVFQVRVERREREASTLGKLSKLTRLLKDSSENVLISPARYSDQGDDCQHLTKPPRSNSSSQMIMSEAWPKKTRMP